MIQLWAGRRLGAVSPVSTPTAGTLYYQTVAHVIRGSFGWFEGILIVGSTGLTFLAALMEPGVFLVTALIMAATAGLVSMIVCIVVQALLTNGGSAKRLQACKAELDRARLNKEMLKAIKQMAAMDMTGMGTNTALPNALWAAAFAILAVSVSQPGGQVDWLLVGLLAFLTIVVLVNYSVGALRSQAVVTVQHAIEELLLEVSPGHSSEMDEA